MDRHGVATFLGLNFTQSARYTIGHGISAGVILMTSHTQPQFPARIGNVTFTDNYETVVIPNCKLEQVLEMRGPQGRYWEVRILDRRWKWLQFGTISGCFNQLDPHGKLIPWSIRSPTEMATMCLEAMKEQNYTIDLPEGINSGDVPEFDYFLPGENAPLTVTNPPIDWYNIPPAHALQQLCDLFGRRIVYRLDTDSIAVLVPGTGADLPDGSIAEDSPSVKEPPKPDVVACVGRPDRYQVRLRIEPVGLEWDGSWQPINALSYAPILPGKKQKVKVSFLNPPASINSTWTIILNGIEFRKTFPGGTPASSMVAYFMAMIDNTQSDYVQPFVIATDGGGGDLILEAKKVGEPFSVILDLALAGAVLPPNPQPAFKQALLREPLADEKSWAYCPPPLFPTVKATDRLTYQEAVNRARGSIWLVYRVVNLDATGEGDINVPGYGKIERRQQLLLNDTQVDQIVPEAIDRNFVGQDGLPLVVNYYDGYSRDKPAACYGSISRFADHAVYIANDNAVTDSNSQVHVPFSIDSVFQLVIFSDYVYTILPVANQIQQGAVDNPNNIVQEGQIAIPKLLLQTAVNVRDPDTNQVIAFRSEGLTPGLPSGTDALVRRHDDVQLEVTATYNDDGSFKDVRRLDQDPINRSKHYVAGMQLQFPATAALTRRYNGIKGIVLDGLTQQVTWSVGAGGPETIASQNSEHEIWVPGYPARRRAERLAPIDVERRLASDPARIKPAEPA